VPGQSLLTRVVAALESVGVVHRLTGSLASSLHGEARATHAIDLVVDIRAEVVTPVVGALEEPNTYLDDQAVADAVRRRTLFNLLDTTTGDQVDFWLLRDEPFDRERFARRTEVEVLGLRLAVSSPEDTILMKLRWAAQSGGRTRQRRRSCRPSLPGAWRGRRSEGADAATHEDHGHAALEGA
jgi:hypothetical protein